MEETLIASLAILITTGQHIPDELITPKAIEVINKVVYCFNNKMISQFERDKTVLREYNIIAIDNGLTYLTITDITLRLAN